MKGEQYMCQICGKEMIGKNRLRNHMMTHPKGQKFVSCEQCGKVFIKGMLECFNSLDLAKNSVAHIFGIFDPNFSGKRKDIKQI